MPKNNENDVWSNVWQSIIQMISKSPTFVLKASTTEHNNGRRGPNERLGHARFVVRVARGCVTPLRKHHNTSRAETGFQSCEDGGCVGRDARAVRRVTPRVATRAEHRNLVQSRTSQRQSVVLVLEQNDRLHSCVSRVLHKLGGLNTIFVVPLGVLTKDAGKNQQKDI